LSLSHNRNCAAAPGTPDKRFRPKDKRRNLQTYVYPNRQSDKNVSREQFGAIGELPQCAPGGLPE
jgi:hypothetical protein